MVVFRIWLSVTQIRCESDNIANYPNLINSITITGIQNGVLAVKINKRPDSPILAPGKPLSSAVIPDLDMLAM
jgi:hypothetical protein